MFEQRTGKNVLISTYWNVNSIYIIVPSLSRIVLISTYWNVNTSLLAKNILFCKSFNLNLLECKFAKFLPIFSAVFVLISTYWNVNKMQENITVTPNTF